MIIKTYSEMVKTWFGARHVFHDRSYWPEIWMLPWHQSTACPVWAVVKTLGWVVLYTRNCTTQIMYGVCRITSHEIGIPRSEPSRMLMEWHGPAPRKLTWLARTSFPQKVVGFQGCKSNSLPPWATSQSYGSTPPSQDAMWDSGKCNHPCRVCYWAGE